ncbi:MAG: hypothetical protein HLUCCX14_15150 [Marinobacter excellens HL-55]|uniref:Uncharacterized protein n=1 Tax=Marinobacter excellens HL-55 TaxID=1305731 RepID=A0A0P8B1H6_9GAMM|nr:MAG: hypothetical protein HLUCCX14_15150 [Marinobacter excellens HL-55]
MQGHGEKDLIRMSNTYNYLTLKTLLNYRTLSITIKFNPRRVLPSPLIVLFLPAARRFGGKQAHWPYASRYFPPTSRVLNAATKRSRLVFLARLR